MSNHRPAAVGYIECCICCDVIHLDHYRSARVWCDPLGVTCAAHAHCLVSLGETDLGVSSVG